MNKSWWWFLGRNGFWAFLLVGLLGSVYLSFDFYIKLEKARHGHERNLDESRLGLETRKLALEENKHKESVTLDKSRIELERYRIDHASRSQCSAPIPQPPTDKEPPYNKRSALQPFLNLVEPLVKAGLILSTDAAALRSELQSAAIESGKEILVHLAKATIDRYIGRNDATGTTTDEKVTSWGARNIQINTVSCPSILPQTKIVQPLRPVKRVKKKVCR